MSAIRVLVVSNLWPYAGDPSYGCFVRGQMESLRPFGVDYSILFINGRASKAAYWKSVGRLQTMLRADSFDLVHAHMGLSGLVARCQLRLPLVVSFLGNDVLGKFTHIGRVTVYDRFLMTSSFVLSRMARAVIVKSEEMKRKLGLASARVIPNGVDLDLFKPIPKEVARQALGLSLEKKLVLFPYRSDETRKRYDVVKSAVEIARRSVPEIELLHVVRVPQSHIALYMNAADVMAVASESEGSPNAVKEALASNLPVVTVGAGDIPDLLRGTEGNYLVEREPRSMAAAIVAAFQRGGRARSRQQMERLSIGNVARQVVDVYESVLKRTD
jgi:glycosyltransferase involved in cell wall biosynthesis